jgi:hypothetical protein
LPAELTPDLYPFPTVGGKEITGSYAISARAFAQNLPESDESLAMETLSSLIDSTIFLPTSSTTFSASFMDRGQRHGTS